VRKQLFEISVTGAKYVLILAGDHLYRMDYATMAEFHWEHDAEITVAVQPVAAVDAPRYGLLKRGSEYRITDFVEKPEDPKVQARFVSRENPERPFLGSMGMYLFNIEVLMDMLENSTYHDFGSQVIPNALDDRRVFGFDFDGFWEDIGTIRSFYETNLRLAQPDSPFNFNDPVQPIYTHPRFLPGSVIAGATMHNVLLADGCHINEADIENSLVGLRSQISANVRMVDTIMMGADYYDAEKSHPDGMPLGIGSNCQIEGAILDKNARFGEGVTIKPFPPGTDIDTEDWSVKDGIVVIPKSTVLQSGTYIGPD
jgi:glucose-1-phosphate adenylyltransferase